MLKKSLESNLNEKIGIGKLKIVSTIKKKPFGARSGGFFIDEAKFLAKIGVGGDFNDKIELEHSKYRITV